MPASSTSELKQLLRNSLLGNTGVTDLVGTNVYGVHLEDADAQTVLTASPMVVFEMLSGSLRWHRAVATQTMEIYGYSKRSNSQASRVYDAVVEYLQHERLQITGIDVTALARESQRPVDGYNGVLDAWFVRGRWVFETS